MSAGATVREQALWDRYGDRKAELHELANRIREGAAAGTLPEQREEEEEAVVEGRLVWRWHRQRERAAGKSAEKKAKTRVKNGELVWEVCDLSESAAKERFGELSGDVSNATTQDLYTR